MSGAIGPILGVDVHAAYGVIDWLAARAAGVEFAIAKCTLGNDPPGDDRSFRRNVDGARAAGVHVGAYHFAFPLPVVPGAQRGRGPREQAERAWRASGELGGAAGELPPALDLEWPPNFERSDRHDPSSYLVDRWKEWRVTGASIAEWGLEYLDHMQRLSGRVPMVYTYPHFWRSLGAAGQLVDFAKYPLWIATYPKSCEAAWLPPENVGPIVPAPWPSWSIWQFSADGSPMRIPGIPVAPIDRNCARDRATLDRLTGRAAAQDAIATEPPPMPDFDIVHPDVPMGRHWEDDEDEIA